MHMWTHEQTYKTHKAGAQLSQPLKKIPQIYGLLFSQNNAPLLWGSTQWLSGLPIQISFCNKGKYVSVYVCVCAQVWEQKSWQEADVQCRAQGWHRGSAQSSLPTWVTTFLWGFLFLPSGYCLRCLIPSISLSIQWYIIFTILMFDIIKNACVYCNTRGSPFNPSFV